uniref:Poly [ADP-ribose] polymerase n=1 Tax=Neogobius melanostomus TaxID=47308 RepID=A0A8C6U288_9GOBI
MFMFCKVYEDYDCMLNQTNIGHNNNKYYVIQIIREGKSYHTWTRWGRVGESGQNKDSVFSSPDAAIKEFEKKFKDKTKNNWSDRENFVDGEEDAEVKDRVDGKAKNVLPCTLDKSTQNLIELIFNTDMFKEAMEEMNLDIKKMPLGKLSKMQITKGFDVLEELEAALNQKNKKAKLEELSSKFFTIIPHNFGRQRPPTIDTKEIIEKKKEMLMVLADIELAQTLKTETEKAQEEIKTVPHPADQNYTSLMCKLTLLDKKSEIYKIIEKYLAETRHSHCPPKIKNVWEVDRDTEGDRFQENDHLENRRLLWHGTNIAVVAAILKSVGRGIYFASENAKSAGYVGTSKNTGIMFLNEVALGKEKNITADDSSLKKAPNGFDSVVARGRVEPDPSKDVFITLDGKQVAVPQGPAIDQPQYKDSHFCNSEYLVYKESQCRIRYLLELHMRY